MQHDCEICRTKDSNPYEFLLTKHWQVALTDDARYPGRSYVTLRSHKGSLSELNKDEWADFEQLVNKLELAATNGLGATMCNWTCLLNNAYQHNPAYPHVHWHFRPRYKQPLELLGKKYKDNEFGRHYRSSWDPTPTPKLSDAACKELIKRYNKALKIS